MLIGECEAFCCGVKIAQSNGLLFEFVSHFFDELDMGTDIEQAVANALCEWDM